ncbi:MAG TPA: M28 family peptidase [Blastocatellia bacterium]|nr:M28 family peptidase [Blastocatellia bacterium]
MKAALAILIAFLLGGGSGPSLPLPPAEATSSITASDLRRHLSFLASDELGGRYALGQSSLIAARYLASQLQSYGYRGAARDRSFLQKVPLVFRHLDPNGSVATLNSAGVAHQFRYGDDYISTMPSAFSFAGSMVFVGYGINSTPGGSGSYTGPDLKGRVVVAMTGRPDSLQADIPSADEDRLLIDARSRGAAGLIVIPRGKQMVTWSALKFQQLTQTISIATPREYTNGPHMVYAGPKLIQALATLLGKPEDYLRVDDGNPRPPAQLNATIEMAVKVEVKETPPACNVAGILEGSDQKLKNEYVVFSAHYDHLQARENGEPYNGADDDGSGTVSVLEIAQALSIGPRPKRSILIIFHTAEELGLFGSEFNTDYQPVVPLDRLVADFNVDMVGRSRPAGDTDPRDANLSDKDSIFLIGSGKLSTELRALSEQTNFETARLRLDYLYDDDNNPERLYYRSDHYNYAKHGIPVIFYFTGLHRDYHQTTDDVDKIDFEKMERIARMILATGWRVANLDHRIAVNKK